MRKWVFASLSLLQFLIAFTAIADVQKEKSPREMVVDSTSHLVAGLKTNRDQIQENFDLACRLAEETVIPHIDMDRVSRGVLGRYWRSASVEQREAFKNVFTTFLRRTYVTAMVNYTDEIISHAENVTYLPERYLHKGKEAIVDMLIALSAGTTVKVSYRMHRYDNGWKIYDVIIEGISLTMTYRNTFGDNIATQGIDQLIADIEQKNKEVAALDSAESNNDESTNP